jgi:hypothetical protein
MPRLERFHLPSGAQAVLDDSEPVAIGGLFAPDAAAFRGRVVDAAGAGTTLRALPLSDFHTLRAVLRRVGAIEEVPLDVRCQNCDRRFGVRPCSTLELGPYRDRELDDPELDARFDFAVEHRLEVSEIAQVRLDSLTLADAEALHVALAKSGPLRLSSGLVRALGLAALDGETDPRRLARRLRRVSPEAFDALVDLFEAAHYPARLITPHPCPDCGAVAWIDAPALREFTLDPGSGSGVAIERDLGPERAPFMNLSRFEDLVSERAEASYDALAVTRVDLVVVDGPAECDDGGEPLLGCYRPADPDGLPPQPPEIRIFYRTFAAIWNDEGEYDVGAEVETTVRHELEHHLAFLSGRDPVDEAERAEIDAELVRRVGRSEVERRAVRAVSHDLRGFLASTWPLWLIALLATLIALYARER